VALPASLRPAVSGDVVQGAILWYPSSPGCFWAEVESVMDPKDDFKG
jgi:hypothetical protein